MVDKAALDKKALLQRILEKSNQKKGSSQRDPNEWKPPTVGRNEQVSIRCFILPPLNKGDKCATGPAKVGMDDCWFVRGGFHWIEKRPYPCSRAFDNQPCPFCQLGFDLLSETADDEAKKKISGTYISKGVWYVNCYFPVASGVPKDVQDKVVFWPLGKQLFDKLDACLNSGDPGDEQDPKPFGFFFDLEGLENYPFQLNIKQKGDFNDYTESKLLTKKVPLALGKDGKPDPKKIEAILSARHDIATKMPARDEAVMKFLQDQTDRVLKGHTDSGTSEGSGFDAEEAKPKAALTIKKPDLKPAAPKPAPAPAKAATKPAAAPAKAPAKPAPVAAKPAPAKPAAKAPPKKVEEPPAEEAPAEEVAEVEAPAEEVPAEAAAEETPAEEVPAEETPAEEVAEEVAVAAEVPGVEPEPEDSDLKNLLKNIRKGKGA